MRQDLAGPAAVYTQELQQRLSKPLLRDDFLIGMLLCLYYSCNLDCLLTLFLFFFFFCVFVFFFFFFFFGIVVFFYFSFFLVFLLTIFGFFFFFCVYECFVCMCICVSCVCSAGGDQKRASHPPELELQMVVSRHVSAGN